MPLTAQLVKMGLNWRIRKIDIFEIRNKRNPTIQMVNAYGFATSPIKMLRMVIKETGITNRIIVAAFPIKLNSFSVKALLFHIDIKLLLNFVS